MELEVVRIEGGYGVRAPAAVSGTDLRPGTLLAVFATLAEARHFADWLTLLRAAYRSVAV